MQWLSRWLTFSATTRFALRKKLLLVGVLMKIHWQQNNKDLLNQMYPFNRFLQRGGNPTSKNWNERKSWLAGCEVAYAVTFHRFYSVFHSSILALTLNNFLCDDLFCFCKPILSRSVNKYCWFWLMLPLLYDVTGHIMCPVKLCYIIQHLRRKHF